MLAYNNTQAMEDAANHAYELEGQAHNFGNILAQYKSPGSRSLEAASAYEKITDAINEAMEASRKGLEAAIEAQNMVSKELEGSCVRAFSLSNRLQFLFFLQSVGVRDKATSSRSRTQGLWDQAQDASRVVQNELAPRLRRAQQDIREVDEKTKTTKDHVEKIMKYVR